jgi:hypothetical protein
MAPIKIIYLILYGIWTIFLLVKAQKNCMSSNTYLIIDRRRGQTQPKYELHKELEEPIELDEMELEKDIEFVVREVGKGSKH